MFSAWPLVLFSGNPSGFPLKATQGQAVLYGEAVLSMFEAGAGALASGALCSGLGSPGFKDMVILVYVDDFPRGGPLAPVSGGVPQTFTLLPFWLKDNQKRRYVTLKHRHVSRFSGN